MASQYHIMCNRLPMQLASDLHNGANRTTMMTTSSITTKATAKLVFKSSGSSTRRSQMHAPHLQETKVDESLNVR